jgi:uncharacterized protein YcbK (DUF882 family)
MSNGFVLNFRQKKVRALSSRLYMALTALTEKETFRADFKLVSDLRDLTMIEFHRTGENLAREANNTGQR